MKKCSLFLSMLCLLTLSACDASNINIDQLKGETSSSDNSSGESSSQSGGEQSSSSGTSSTEESSSSGSSESSESSSGTSLTEEQTIDECPFVSLALSDNGQYLELNSRVKYPPLVYYLNGDNVDLGESLSDEDKEVIFTSSDTSIITVDQYGRATGKSIGNAYVICRSVKYGFEATCLIRVVSSIANLKKEYQLVDKDDIDTLKAGDTLVFGVPSNNSTASDVVVSSDLMSTASTFSSDGKKISSLGADSAEFMLGGYYNHWTLEVELETSSGRYVNKYLAAFNTKRVGYVNKTGNIEWEIGVDADDDKLYIQSAANIYGWLMLNTNTGAYTIYESNENYHMFLPSIYRLTIVN